MSARFQELDWRPTPIGELSLRRRWDPAFHTDVLEIKLDDEYLMSSLFTHGETELARLALSRAGAHPGDARAGGDARVGGDARAGEPPAGVEPLDVVVGGLGLGYTAEEVLQDPRVGSLLVVEALETVIDWHQRELIPAGALLRADPRCRFVHGDFFALADSPSGLDPQQPGSRFHAIIVDIDHSPSHLLHPSHREFYRPEGLRRVAASLHRGGVFALWSNDPPEQEFLDRLGAVFTTAEAEVVRFPNPLQDREATNTVYLGRTAA